MGLFACSSVVSILQYACGRRGEWFTGFIRCHVNHLHHLQPIITMFYIIIIIQWNLRWILHIKNYVCTRNVFFYYKITKKKCKRKQTKTKTSEWVIINILLQISNTWMVNVGICVTCNVMYKAAYKHLKLKWTSYKIYMSLKIKSYTFCCCCCSFKQNVLWIALNMHTFCYYHRHHHATS